jgi:hypothetical protein
MSGYKFTRAWFDFCFDNPEKIKPVHHAIYHFTLDRCNRLGWKSKFGFSTDFAMETLGIKNYRTYSKALNDLVSFGFIKMIQKSKNQHTSNVIALVENPKANTKALDRALQMQGESTASIDKPLNNQKLNNKTLSEIEISEIPDDLNNYFQIAIKFQKVFIQNLLEKQAPTKVQERAKFGSYVTPIRLMMEKDGVTSSQFDRALKLLRSPDGEFWKKHILSTQKLREKISQLLSIEQKKLVVNNSTMNLSVSEKLKSYE